MTLTCRAFIGCMSCYRLILKGDNVPSKNELYSNLPLHHCSLDLSFRIVIQSARDRFNILKNVFLPTHSLHSFKVKGQGQIYPALPSMYKLCINLLLITGNLFLLWRIKVLAT